MTDNKLKNWKKIEIVFLLLILVFIIINASISNDNPIAAISACCGITYTFIAGKGNPICYLFGVIGSSFYGILSFQNALWGNLILYMAYYVPMQIYGFFQWNKNLKQGKKDIVKISLPHLELKFIVTISILSTILAAIILYKLNDTHPILDSISTIVSISGMYLTVRRAIEQWIFWMVVNFVSFMMWANVALSGEKVYSTVIMWGVYLVLAVYFYIVWKKEIDLSEGSCYKC